MGQALLIGLALLASGPRWGQTAPKPGVPNSYPDLKDVGVTEKLGDYLPDDLEFRDMEDKPVRIRDLAAGRPVILTLNYADCPVLCNQQLTGLVEGLNKVKFALGKDYCIVTVSINPKETAERCAAAHKHHLEMYHRPVNERRGWHFLRGDEAPIRRLADAVGFRYNYVADRREYAHQACLFLVSPDMKVTRYLYGVAFEPDTLRLGILEASAGTVGSTVDRVLLNCYYFDLEKGSYVLSAIWLMKAGGVLTLAAMGGMFAYFLRREARRRRAEEDADAEREAAAKSPQTAAPAVD